MEVKIADILWKRSITEGNFRYTRFLSNGDAKVFKHLTEENIYNTPIEKEDCINHVKKRMGTALRNEVQTAKKKGITLGGRAAGSLTEKTILGLTNYYRTSILRYKTNVNAMRKDILATLSYCSSTDQAPDHSLCPKGKRSWCFYNKARAKNFEIPSHNNMTISLNAKLVTHIRPIYERLANVELLRRCRSGLTQNSNES